ncbi:MAG: sensor histidine kinase [Opitutae bacterium]
MSAEKAISLPLSRARGRLAGTPAAVISSPLMTAPPIDTEAKLLRAKGRLYVLCQLAGWGAYLAMNLVLSGAFADSDGSNHSKHDQLTNQAIMVFVVMLGLLLTHYARSLMTRWRWKELGWRALIPRVLLMAIVLSFLWSGLGYGYTHGIIGVPRTSKYSLILLFSVSWIYGTGMLVGWLCLYFFYHIFERLNRLMVEQLRMTANVKEAELRALKSQVNPHFLFNSLNSLRALIDEDAPRAREAVTRLANMLRYSLQAGQLETVSLEEELRTVEDYLALEQIRHEDRLQVRWQIAEAARTRAVPPMLLQTLVENAVKYGISTRREGGEVVISAQTEGAMLVITVANPGTLAPAGNAASAIAGSSTGVGLRNASERLKLLYGEHAVLRLSAEPAGCVTASVSIPLLSNNP